VSLYVRYYNSNFRQKYNRCLGQQCNSGMVELL
jgi:hypothetical protein